MKSAEAHIGDHVLCEWLGAGTDGVRYSARDAAGHDVELRHVHAPAVRGERGRTLALLSRIPHAGLLRVLSFDLEPAHVILERGLTSWEDPEAWPTTPDELGSALRNLASALGAAHALSVVHGELSPGDVWRKAKGFALDLSGLHAMPASPIPIAPELGDGAPPTTAADVWSLAAIFEPIVNRVGASERVRSVIESMKSEDPEARPSARLVYERLETTAAVKVTPVLRGSGELRQLGPYELMGKLGSGGMGSVFRARDIASGQIVALKVLSGQWSDDPDALARFRREARILSRLHSPHVARFVQANEDGGIQYLAMELVEGKTALSMLSKDGPMSVAAASSIACCVLRALSEVHTLGLLHRDVKPSNILVAEGSPPESPRAKLCDFGIARSADASEPAVTRAGTIGTPFYMAPEQLEGGEFDCRVDVYALGCTLFELLTGQPPFTGDSTNVILAHIQTPAPDVRTRRSDVPEPLALMIDRALSKQPHERFDDASRFLEALEIWRRGALVGQDALPQPIDLAGTPILYANAWELSSAPHELWPHVSNTERLNRAIGLDDVEWMQEDGVRHGSFRAAGMLLRWKENPFEWVAPNRLGVVREYTSGPFDWLRSTVELTPHGTGTTLKHTIEIRPRNIVGRFAAGIEVGVRMKRALERVYRRIDESCRHARAGASVDPFEDARPPSMETARKLDVALSHLTSEGCDPYIVEALRRFIESAPPQRLARIRPRAWAREQGMDEAQAINVLMRAAHQGILVPLWDILCPTCRIPSSIHDSLRALRDHGRCDACQLDFELDLARSVELVFRVHPNIRDADLGVYCIGGPAHSPHVHAQVRLVPGQRLALDLSLAEGSYVIASRALDAVWRFGVHERASVDSWEVPLASGLSVETPRSLKLGAQHIVLANDLDCEAVVRIESTVERGDSFTAADASAHALFRALFPHELLASEQLIGVSKVALLFADVPSVAEGDEREIYRALSRLLAQARDAAAHEGGALVKLHGDAVLAVFTEPAAAMRAALRLVEAQDIRISLHAGSAMMATIQDRLDYFGRTVQLGAALLYQASPGDIVISDEMGCDPGTEELQRTRTRPVGVLRAGGLVATRVRID